jgi:hypothetical protein
LVIPVSLKSIQAKYVPSGFLNLTPCKCSLI